MNNTANRNQQRVKYLIEFKLPGGEASLSEENNVEDSVLSENDVDFDWLEIDSEPPKKKRKLLDNRKEDTLQLQPDTSAITNPYLNMLATAKSNYDLLTNKTANYSVARQPTDDIEDESVTSEGSQNGNAPEVELREGVRLLPIKEVNPFVLNIAVKGRVIYKSEIFKWTADKKHTRDGCFFYFEIIDANVRMTLKIYSIISHFLVIFGLYSKT